MVEEYTATEPVEAVYKEKKLLLVLIQFSQNDMGQNSKVWMALAPTIG
jgi:hypothetical protein